MISVQVVSVDYYMECGSYGICAPVIRIFGVLGSSDARVLLHIHQVYPYFYVRYIGSMGNLDEYISQLTANINAKSIIVHKIIAVKGIPFYGYHNEYEVFLKIYITDPKNLSALISDLETGNIMGELFQIYEGHITYMLQFLIDYNIYGMDMIDLSFVRFRGLFKL